MQANFKLRVFTTYSTNLFEFMKVNVQDKPEGIDKLIALPFSRIFFDSHRILSANQVPDMTNIMKLHI